VDSRDALGNAGRAATAGHGRRAALWLWPSAKVVKTGDDDDDVGMIPV
jgi:hypothetical protein